MIKEPAYFVDFLRDIPEATGEEDEGHDMERPTIYEPVHDWNLLKDKLKSNLDQYNDILRGSNMDLVFFPDAMKHVLKISRVIRNPRGNIMLVGVGGSGKQSLAKLASFIAGYKIFQITITRSYNTTNFVEDLKVLFRTCGTTGEGTTFLFTDQDIKEEGFLDYINNVLASGISANFFTRDEQGEIIAEATPIMKRESKIPPTAENVMQWFLDRVNSNLHIILCFSPGSKKFQGCALKFPGLISGCTMDWFQPWPKDALVAVASHFFADFEMACTQESKHQLYRTMASVQESLSDDCRQYYKTYQRQAHVTPRSYLSFINSYKEVYAKKETEIKQLSMRMNAGLNKLKEASESVETLTEDLAAKEKILEAANTKAEEVLEVVAKKAQEAEHIKNKFSKAKERAEEMVQT